MKIIFICGSFEPGRDGVGDYVRRLSEELVGRGHHVAVAAVNDKHLGETESTGILPQSEISVQRLPQRLSQRARFLLLSAFVDNFNPDWLSLQYVPFSFHPKGLPFGLAKKLLSVGRERKWHIMFHELWVGMSEECSRKEAMWGMLQRELIRDMVKTLHPSAVHTHTHLYKKQLEKLGAQPVLLPLFSNIPVTDQNKVNQKIEKGISMTNPVKIVIFGGIHKDAPVKELAQEAAYFSKTTGMELELVIIGRNGKEQQRWAEQWTDVGLKAIQMGEQDAEKVSEILADVSFGIFTTPIALVEKSGSVAAMREHGNHLLCVSQAWNPVSVSLDDNPFGILEYRKINLEYFFLSKPDFSYMPTIFSVSDQFITNLMNK